VSIAAFPNNPGMGLGPLPSSVVNANAHFDLGQDTQNNVAIGAAWTPPNGMRQNVAIGGGAMSVANATSIRGNVAIGYNALNAFTAGPNNTAIGWISQQLNQTGVGNVSVGANTLAHITATSSHTAVGAGALYGQVTGTDNTCIGANSMHNPTTGSYNVAVGSSAMTNYGGNSNFALGYNTLSAVGLTAGTGNNNIAIGHQSAYAPRGSNANLCLAGSNNTYVGYETGAPDASDPSNGVAIGALALARSWSTALGAGTSASADGAVAIGADHTGLSATSATQDLIALGTVNHTTYLAGQLRVAPAAFAAGDRYLVVDAQGNVHVSALGPAL
jgi:trimeric autotransporter adhesin